ncbi:1-aminocyclopropane-1-carboxylate deaminase/D-cysteine desulfhydrase [Mesonia mobilis]|uniref:1-aminocyclopropane-1-carboxylate deaminase n=1 Tax=Mesonia mobilis TaxID=369791 RepID=A0ABQ3BHR4_9FLAO|nr:pyridoxal-phosphate dependent enzyme [Mesonia mobilis]MBQ0739159.1 1-aminocyclopropane-1-carboxylate deaminase/D-cysteine desulfhydrase [Aquimarina celericrescens]GGZ45810.1 1-aminocyclopropane-1-carboxylate deaminase [Mesonia mobilis]
MIKTPQQKLNIQNEFSAELYIRREDLLHPFVSGNKFRKLKYNLLEAEKTQKETIVTFGGAFSNHIAATAAACQERGLKSIGIIRGEELAENLEQTLAGNPTLRFAQQCGMQFKFVSRTVYREKNNAPFINELESEFPNSFIVPEGGTNELAVKGCEEILTEQDEKFDIICCPVGTGGTISGLINASKKHQKILGFPALKGDFLQKEIDKFAEKNNYELILDYHFGGYAKVNVELIEFINKFNEENNIPLDPIYTGKMVFGIFDLLKKGKFNNKKVLMIHTGGLQGIEGMNLQLAKKNLPLIK